MLPDRVSNPGPLTYESGALPIALRGPAAVGAVEVRGLLYLGHMKGDAHSSPLSALIFPGLKRKLLHCCFTSTVNI